jgi:hypothetical protein
MGIFNKPVTKAAISVPSVQAAVGYAPLPRPQIPKKKVWVLTQMTDKEKHD